MCTELTDNDLAIARNALRTHVATKRAQFEAKLEARENLQDALDTAVEYGDAAMALHRVREIMIQRGLTP